MEMLSTLRFGPNIKIRLDIYIIYYEEFYKLKKHYDLEGTKEDYEVVNIYLIYTFQINFVENNRMFRIRQVTL